MYDWIDKYITEQKEQEEVVKKTIAPYVLGDLISISETEEVE